MHWITPPTQGLLREISIGSSVVLVLMLPTSSQVKLPWIGGRLGMSLEGSGKRRIFAIGNYVKQRLLHPFHTWLMTILKSIPNDGTFEHTKPLTWIKGYLQCFSFDLKSATDRWPLYYLFSIVEYWLGHNPAGSIVNTTLGHNVFMVPSRKPRSVCFVAGQPLGYYSSWPLFALSHVGVVLCRISLPRSYI
jgi:hypothetical protein